ncbi:MAG: cation diffusion facilitator family transporter [Burkholderiaceae bacterium]
MSACCQPDHAGHSHGPTGLVAGTPEFFRYRKILWAAFIINAAMFGVEAGAALQADSLALLADSIDFLGDAANYLVSLAVLGASLAWRARTAMLKGLFMLSFGAYIAVKAVMNFYSGVIPDAMTMGVVGSLALVANLSVAIMLYRFRQGDANMRSVWLCTRNDSLSNIAVMVAALGVFGTASGWPDLLVAAVMAGLALTSGVSVVRQAARELSGGASDTTSVDGVDKAEPIKTANSIGDHPG